MEPYRYPRSPLTALLWMLLPLAAPLAHSLGPAPGPAILVDVTESRTLLEHEADRPWFPASLTKLMTLYLTFEALGAGRLQPGTTLPVSAAAAAQPATKLGLDAATGLSVDRAIEALAVVSANDAAVVLAEGLAGDEPRFVAEMNRTAQRLGLAATRFRNATGLPGPGQHTTARDMARLAAHLLADFPAQYRYFATPAIRSRGRSRGNHNRLLQIAAAVDGLKTGFTCDAGYNVVASAAQGGRRLVAVVLGARSPRERDSFAAGLLRAGFAGGIEPRPPGPPPGPASVPVSRLGAGCGPAPGSLLTAESRLRGWGIFLGNFTDERAARERIAAVRKLLAASAAGGAARPRGALLPREGPRGRSWKALVANLTAEQAGRACKALWAQSWTCAAHSPQRIAMAGYREQ